jgi:hypothetical protein
MISFLKKISTYCLLLLLTQHSYAQDAKTLFNTVISKAQSLTNNKNNSVTNFTNTDAVSALKEMLQTGSQNASGKLATANCYLSNSLVKILLPPEATKVEATVRMLGLGNVADKTILYMNRAAEDAASKATPIFVNAIKNMTIQDGIAIVKGGNGAATNFLKTKTTADLTTAFKPVIEKSLNQYNVATYWNQLFSIYNKLPTTKMPINSDLTSYVTERALNGLFLTISQEEDRIRTDPTARVTALLQKVFGGK